MTIAAGTSLDVIEMDAASNRSVDDIRELRERVGFAPAAGRWKVYILDEAHMLTKEAWNAFLKTLEEPPPNTAFVLATTEPQKVMATIVDRCQRFDFQRPSLEQIAEVVRRVSVAEGIEIEDGAVALISRSATGSFRDALGTLDQLVAFGGDKRRRPTTWSSCSAPPTRSCSSTPPTRSASGDARAALAGGRAPVALGPRPGPVRARPDRPSAPAAGRPRHRRGARVLHGHRRRSRSGSQARRSAVDDAKLMGAIDALSAAVAAMREGDDPRLTLEVALLKVATPSLDSSREALLRRIESLESRADRRGGEPPRLQTKPESRPRRRTQRRPPANRVRAGEPDERRDRATVEIEQVVELWPAVVDHLRDSGSAMLSTLFDEARPLGVDEERSVLRIGFPGSAKFNKKKAEAPANVERMTDAIGAIVGDPNAPGVRADRRGESGDGRRRGLAGDERG